MPTWLWGGGAEYAICGNSTLLYLECDGSYTITHRTEHEKGEFHCIYKINRSMAKIIEVGLFYFYF